MKINFFAHSFFVVAIFVVFNNMCMENKNSEPLFLTEADLEYVKYMHEKDESRSQAYADAHTQMYPCSDTPAATRQKTTDNPPATTKYHLKKNPQQQVKDK